MKELLEETFFGPMETPEDIEDLSIEGLFDVVHTIEKKGFYFQLENKVGYGHHASFWINDSQGAGASGFCEFRLEAIADAIRSFLEK